MKIGSPTRDRMYSLGILAASLAWAAVSYWMVSEGESFPSHWQDAVPGLLFWAAFGLGPVYYATMRLRADLFPTRISKATLVVPGFRPRSRRIGVADVERIGLELSPDSESGKCSYTPTLVRNSDPALQLAQFADKSHDEAFETAEEIAEMLGVPGPGTDPEWLIGIYRHYWEERSSSAAMSLVDGVRELVREATEDNSWQLKYLDDESGEYIGNWISVTRGKTSESLFVMDPHEARGSAFVRTEIKLPRSDELTTQLKAAGVDVRRYSKGESRYRLRITQADLTDRRPIMIDLIQRAAG